MDRAWVGHGPLSKRRLRSCRRDCKALRRDATDSIAGIVAAAAAAAAIAHHMLR